MYSIKAIYDGTNFKPIQPIPVEENYEVIITFVEPINKDQSEIMQYFGTFDKEDFLDIDEIMEERKNFSLGRPKYDDFF